MAPFPQSQTKQKNYLNHSQSIGIVLKLAPHMLPFLSIMERLRGLPSTTSGLLKQHKVVVRINQGQRL